MRIGIVVDSACDLPPNFIAENNIVILPISMHLDGQSREDTRNLGDTLEFYREHVMAAAQAETTPYSSEQIKRLFLDKLVLEYDLVFCFILASSRSRLFENATQASFSILSEYKAVRAAAGVPGPFTLRVIDTQNLFAGQAVPVIECVRMIKAGEPPNSIRERMEHIVLNTHTYFLPRDLKQLRAGVKRRGVGSGKAGVNWAQYALGTALDLKPLVKAHRNNIGPVAKLWHFDEGIGKCFRYLESRIQAGLLAPGVVVSYGGDVQELQVLPGFSSMVSTARKKGVAVHCSTMSMTSGIHVGEGGVTFAFASPDHELSL